MSSPAVSADVAILSGDMLLIKAYQLLGSIDAELLPEAFDLLNDTSKELCEGQQFDLDFEEKVRRLCSSVEIKLKNCISINKSLKGRP